MLLSPRCLVALGALVLPLGAAACVGPSTCEAALAGVERAHADAARHEMQLAWLRYQLATFAADLQAHNARDRELLLQKLSVLEAANLALVARLEHADHDGGSRPQTPGLHAPRVEPPPSVPRPSVEPLPIAAAPVNLEIALPRVKREVAGAAPAHTIDEASPY